MRYSLSEFISTTYSWILTKVFFPKARLVRRPVYIRGGRYLMEKDLLQDIVAGLICQVMERRHYLLARIVG